MIMGSYVYYFEPGVNSDCLLYNTIVQVQEVICPWGSIHTLYCILDFKLHGPS